MKLNFQLTVTHAASKIYIVETLTGDGAALSRTSTLLSIWESQWKWAFKAAQNLVAKHYERDFDMNFHFKGLFTHIRHRDGTVLNSAIQCIALRRTGSASHISVKCQYRQGWRFSISDIRDMPVIFAVLSIHTYPACHSTGSVIIEMTSFEDEELAMIAIILDEEEEEQRKKTRVWVHNEGKKRDVEGEFATLYKEPETLTLYNS